jgi:hypothetical protein
MGGVITVDPRILELAERGREYRVVAHTLALMQHHVSKNLGHIVAVNDDTLWRHIVKAAKDGKYPASTARCLRCGAPATLTDWITTSQLRHDERHRKWIALRQSQGVIASDFMAFCQGERKARWTMEALDAYAREQI